MAASTQRWTTPWPLTPELAHQRLGPRCLSYGASIPPLSNSKRGLSGPSIVLSSMAV